MWVFVCVCCGRLCACVCVCVCVCVSESEREREREREREIKREGKQRGEKTAKLRIAGNLDHFGNLMSATCGGS